MEDSHGVLPVADVSPEVLCEYEARAAAQCPPADAQEYMWRVRFEAASLPDITNAHVVVAHPTPNTLRALFLPELPPFPTQLALSSAARMQVLSEFADLRQYLIHVEATLVARPSRLDNLDFPKMSEEAQWRAFFRKNPPAVKVLLQMDQVLTQRLLHTMMNWLDDDNSEDEVADGAATGADTPPRFSRLRAVWLYGLLARLEKPLVADMDACVRQIFRWCWMTRSTALTTTERESLNVLVCICDFFGQGEERRADVTEEGQATGGYDKMGDAIRATHEGGASR
ncbi:Aste57867_1755 [Aphanomyces stellatus]|uniref:Gem-associated protein 2 n=1 Tax=Aphanomyces stellatus TaxID=120398 RepID=A0A485K6G7_9STRA|nr:hypothetical protein As57867_001753 [Aphanomyces stellatus]VFT78964.1 Aste57867_1755 [Aphanomyces stellatus]